MFVCRLSKLDLAQFSAFLYIRFMMKLQSSPLCWQHESIQGFFQFTHHEALLGGAEWSCGQAVWLQQITSVAPSWSCPHEHIPRQVSHLLADTGTEACACLIASSLSSSTPMNLMCPSERGSHLLCHIVWTSICKALLLQQLCMPSLHGHRPRVPPAFRCQLSSGLSAGIASGGGIET